MRAHQPAIPVIVRMHRDGHVGENRLRPLGGDGDTGTPIGAGVPHVPQLRLHLLVLHLQVGDGAAVSRTPVHHALAAVDESLVVQAHEGFNDRAGIGGIQREDEAVPVTGKSHTFELLDNDVAVLVFPPPHPLLELLAPQLLQR